MLPIMLDYRTDERKQMIHDALEVKAPQMYQELKKSLKLQNFLKTQEQMMMDAFREERGRLMMESVCKPDNGEHPIEQTQELERNLLQAWNETKATYLDFSDPSLPSENIKVTAKFQGTGQHEGKSLKDLFKMYPKGKIVRHKK